MVAVTSRYLQTLTPPYPLPCTTLTRGARLCLDHFESLFADLPASALQTVLNTIARLILLKGKSDLGITPTNFLTGGRHIRLWKISLGQVNAYSHW